MTVNDLVSSAMILYMQGGKDRELEDVSRSENSQLGWYYWLKEVPGVYEIELKGYHPETNRQGNNREEFYVRYYPALDEEILENYSVAEQMIRFDCSVFDDSDITTDLEEHEICPCCGVPHKSGDCHPEDEHGHDYTGHEHHDDGHMHSHEECHCDHEHGHEELRRRPKGIPNLLKKFDMNRELFKIGDLTVVADMEDNTFRAELRTKERLLERAPEAIRIQQGEEITELVEKGGINRNVPGYKLAERFMKFFGGQVLAAMGNTVKKAINKKEEPETASGSCPNADEASDITIQYIFRKGG